MRPLGKFRAKLRCDHEAAEPHARSPAPSRRDAPRLRRLHFHLQPARSIRYFSMDIALVETEKPPHARNLDEAETKDLGGYDRGLSKTAKSRRPQPRQPICDAKCLWRRSFFVAALDQAEVKQLRWNGHFSIDGTLIEMGSVSCHPGGCVPCGSFPSRSWSNLLLDEQLLRQGRLRLMRLSIGQSPVCRN